MIQLAIKYFIRFGQFEIPNVGQLRLSKKEAEFNDGILKAPFEKIEFEKGEGKPTKQFYQYLANALDISADQATIQYEQFWKNKLEDNIIHVGSLGSISKNEGNYLWQSHFDATNYYNNIEIEPRVTNDIFEAPSIANDRERWEIWAIVLTVVALLAILLK